MRLLWNRSRLPRSLLLLVRPSPLIESEAPSAPAVSADERCAACGAARTVLERPPDWRIPAALIAIVVAVIVIGLLIALVSLSIQANHP